MGKRDGDQDATMDANWEHCGSWSESKPLGHQDTADFDISTIRAEILSWGWCRRKGHRVTKYISIHPLWTMNIYIKFHPNLIVKSSCSGPKLCTDRLTDKHGKKMLYCWQVWVIQQKDAKPYLILVLFSPLHLCWSIGQVLWTFIKLMFHGVDGMTTREKKEEGTVNLMHVSLMFKLK